MLLQKAGGGKHALPRTPPVAPFNSLFHQFREGAPLVIVELAGALPSSIEVLVVTCPPTPSVLPRRELGSTTPLQPPLQQTLAANA